MNKPSRYPQLVTASAVVVTLASLSLSVSAQVTIPATTKVTPVTAKRGFIWRVFNNSAAQANNNQRTEDALSGLLKDAEGNALPNNADPSAQGIALAPATAPSPANAPISFEIETFINLNQAGGGAQGTFPDDDQMPGIPGTDGSTDGTAAEVLTYIELTPGTYTMGVASDDGFRALAGNTKDAFQGVMLGEFNGGRGTAETTFKFKVAEAGVYPFRVTYEEGGGGSDIEWYTVKDDGTKILVNDTANGGVKAYRAATSVQPPYVKQVSPQPGNRQLNGVSSSVVLVLADGDASTIDDASIDFKIDGKAVTDKKRDGKTVTLTWTPSTIQFPNESHTASLTFSGSGGFTRTENWTFRNLKNVILPATSIAGEDFDSYPEGGQPTGWVATNFTVDCSPDETDENIEDQKSDPFKNWVVISTDTMPKIDDSFITDVNGNEKVNGTKLTLDMLRSGNVLYAESDSRCNGTNPDRATEFTDANYGQTQFIVTKAYNLSTASNPVLSFSSGYYQNQDSYGGVEYSVDGGKTFLPVVYYLDIPVIFVKEDGTTDGPGTFNAKRTDTSLWVDNGVQKGTTYGDALAAPINDAIGNYIAPRVNDDGAEGKRVEIFRLPAAANKSDVRLRLSATGSDSWYFYVDNIKFYDIAPPTVAAGTLKAPTISGSNVVISWNGAGTLQESTSISGPWTDSTSQANPQNVPSTGAAAKYYRLKN